MRRSSAKGKTDKRNEPEHGEAVFWLVSFVASNTSWALLPRCSLDGESPMPPTNRRWAIGVKPRCVYCGVLMEAPIPVSPRWMVGTK